MRYPNQVNSSAFAVRRLNFQSCNATLHSWCGSQRNSFSWRKELYLLTVHQERRFVFLSCLPDVSSWRPASPSVFPCVEQRCGFVEFPFALQYCCSVPSLLALLNIHYLLPSRHCILSVSLILLTFCSVIQCHPLLVLPSISLKP